MKKEIHYRGFVIRTVEQRLNRFTASINHNKKRLYRTTEVRTAEEARAMAQGMVDWYFFDLVTNPAKLFQEVYRKEQTS